jgi:hypothetical protein
VFREKDLPALRKEYYAMAMDSSLRNWLKAWASGCFV